MKATAVTYTDALIMDGINAGCKAILPWCSKRAVETITVTSGSLIELPSDVYLVDALYSSQDSIWLKRFSIKGGVNISTMHPAWYEYPTGKITLTLDTYDGLPVDVHYLTCWNEIETTGSPTTEMDTPSFTDLAVVYYAVSYCLASAATQTSQLRQFNTKVDSGNPEDNPLKEMSALMMQRFLNEVKLMPTIERAQ